MAHRGESRKMRYSESEFFGARKRIVAARSRDTLPRVGTGVMNVAMCAFGTSVLAFSNEIGNEPLGARFRSMKRKETL
jgi:hypothetical protein